LTVYAGITLLAGTSTTVSLFAASTEQWSSYLVLIATGVGVFYGAAALWWATSARARRAR